MINDKQEMRDTLRGKGPEFPVFLCVKDDLEAGLI